MQRRAIVFMVDRARDGYCSQTEALLELVAVRAESRDLGRRGLGGLIEVTSRYPTDETREAIHAMAAGALDVPRPLLEQLAKVLGGAVACSRPVVQAGVLPYLRQVGQTGKTVAPQLYFGVGVSGAVQHLVGMQGSRKIIAINSDRNAPLVKIADYALIGDYHKIVPDLIKGFEARSAEFKAKGSRP